MKKKVLIVVSHTAYFMTHRLGIALGLKNQGFEIAVATSFASPEEERSVAAYGFETFDLHRAKGFALLTGLRLFFRLRHLFKVVKPDYIFIISMRMVFIGLLAFHLSGAKRFIGLLAGLGYLGTSRQFFTRVVSALVFTILKYLCLSKNVCLIVQNRDDYCTFSGKLISSDRLKLIKGSGVSLIDYPDVPEPEQPPVIVTFVARMLRDKGVLDLIESAKLLRKQGRKDIIIQLLGEVYDANPQSLTQQEMINLLHGETNIKWLGYRKDVAQFYQTSHIAILPSYREGLPKALLEAAASARPIITTDVPGCREICQHGKNGYLVPVKNPKALVEAILRLADKPQRRRQFGQEGRKMVEKYFSDTVINKQIVALFQPLNTAQACQNHTVD